jgi:hypothetical protein
MDFITNLLDGIGSINYEPIFQLTFVALIMIAGPVVIFLLAFRGGDL